jgi:hypothetical protein
MKSTAIAFAVAALGFGSLAYAQGHHGERDSRSASRHGYASQEYRGGDSRSPSRHGYASQYYRGGEHRGQRAWADGGHRQWDQRQQQPHYPQRYDRPRAPERGYYGYPGQYVQPRPNAHWQARVPQYRRGDHLPYQFRQRHHYVNDWRAYRLYAPPPGHHWVRADSGDYLLVAIATGLIVNLLLNQ